MVKDYSYLVGQTILVTKLEDEYVKLPKDKPALMTVDFVDGVGQLHGVWTNVNTSVAVIPGVDEFEIYK